MAIKQQLPPKQPNVSKATAQLQAQRISQTSQTQSGIRPRTIIGPLVKQARHTLQGQFLVLAIVLLISSLSMMFFFLNRLQATQDQLNIIAIKSVNSVDASQRLLQYVEDVDAKSADYIPAAAVPSLQPCQIIGTNTSGPNPMTYHNCDVINIDAELTLANKELYVAIRNATYPGERTALDRIAAGLSEYKADVKVEQHEYDLASTNFDPTNPHLINAKNAYYQATNVVNIKIMEQPVPDASDEQSSTIPSCTISVRTPSGGMSTQTLSAQQWTQGSLEENVECLTAINKLHLDETYNQVQSHLALTLFSVFVTSIIFCALLIFILWRVIRLTHRYIPLTLALATLLGLAFCGFVVLNFAGLYGIGQPGAVQVMVKNSYESIYNAEQINQYATAASADQSRWLIAVTFNDQDQIDRWQQDWYNNRDKTTNLIHQAQANQHWPEESNPLATIQQHWKTYTDIDPQIRAKANNTSLSLYNRMIDAQTLSLGRSNDNFFEFSNAVTQLSSVTIDTSNSSSGVNRDHLNSIYNGENTFLTVSIPLCLVVFLLIAVFASTSVLRCVRDF